VDASQYDAIVIGSGRGVSPLAKAGMRAALIERKHLGGNGPTRLISSAAQPMTSA
jgi:pyruvate/2-oxoglutarate dehydrogenase complex dihydrolipoamide dehydrogenase (E3) component